MSEGAKVVRPLSLAERRVLALAAHPNKEIGALLGISTKTVKHRFTRVYGKLGMLPARGRRSSDRVKALLLGLWLGFLEAGDVSPGPGVCGEGLL